MRFCARFFVSFIARSIGLRITKTKQKPRDTTSKTLEITAPKIDYITSRVGVMHSKITWWMKRNKFTAFWLIAVITNDCQIISSFLYLIMRPQSPFGLFVFYQVKGNKQIMWFDRILDHFFSFEMRDSFSFGLVSFHLFCFLCCHNTENAIEAFAIVKKDHRAINYDSFVFRNVLCSVAIFSFSSINWHFFTTAALIGLIAPKLISCVDHNSPIVETIKSQSKTNRNVWAK